MMLEDACSIGPKKMLSCKTLLTQSSCALQVALMLLVLFMARICPSHNYSWPLQIVFRAVPMYPS